MTSNETDVARSTLPYGWLVAAAIALLGFALIRAAAGNTAASRIVISTASTGLGTTLVDSRGHTLYLFEKDRNGRSTCSGQCATNWPPVIASGRPVAGPGVRASLLGETKRADGRVQVTYNHHPLYFFSRDTKKGQANGENVDAFGAEWYAVSPAGTHIEPKSSSTPAPSSGSGY
jgi:predicted lipoprotein with Yx(FWY)xxD motif